MSKNKFPITERTISNKLGRPIQSPIRVHNLKAWNLNTDLFLKTFSPFFEELPWDFYDVKKLQLAFLKNKFPQAIDAIQTLEQDFFMGKTNLDIFQKWTVQLDEKDLQDFEKIQPWRRHAVARFVLNNIRSRFFMTRHYDEEEFVFLDKKNNARPIPIMIVEAPEHHLENHWFASLLIKTFKIVQTFHPECTAKISVHFIREQTTIQHSIDVSLLEKTPSLMLELVIHRKNIKGGESQVLEKMKDGSEEVILKHTLKPSEFIFLADAEAEIGKIQNKDFSYQVSTLELDNAEEEGWRDFIRFDIQLIDEENASSEIKVQF